MRGKNILLAPYQSSFFCRETTVSEIIFFKVSGTLYPVIALDSNQGTLSLEFRSFSSTEVGRMGTPRLRRSTLLYCMTRGIRKIDSL